MYLANLLLFSIIAVANATPPFVITSGADACKLAASLNNDYPSCFISANYPADYDSDQTCKITLQSTGKLKVVDFVTEERWDYVKLGGKEYSGTTGPIDVAVKHGDVIDLYAAFDVYYIAKQDQRNLIFMNTSEPTKTRHGMLLKVISALKPESMITGQPSPVRIEAKQFYSSGNIFEDNNMIIQKTNDGLFEYETDGLVFTPTNLSLARDYVKKTWDKSFKWKPPEFNSIDFLVKMKNESQELLLSTTTYYLIY